MPSLSLPQSSYSDRCMWWKSTCDPRWEPNTHRLLERTSSQKWQKPSGSRTKLEIEQFSRRCGWWLQLDFLYSWVVLVYGLWITNIARLSEFGDGTLVCHGEFCLKGMDGGKLDQFAYAKRDYWPFKALDDWFRILLLPCMGNLASTLPEWTTRRIYAKLAKLLLDTRSHSYSWK